MTRKTTQTRKPGTTRKQTRKPAPGRSNLPLANIDRLEEELYELAKIGFNPKDKGIYRQAYSDADMESRRWLMKQIEKAGGKARMDAAGNVIGRWFDDLDGPDLVIGSHTDSVPAGGMFDGALGVLAGLEAIRRIHELKIKPKRPLELVSFADEEGYFGGMFGVQAYCGQVTLGWIQSAHTADGLKLTDAMQAQGLDPKKVLNIARKPNSIYAFLELHIEQGPVLETKDLSIGVVEAISGVFKWVITLKGKANHAGTAPMDMRSDAFMGLVDFAHEIPRIISEDGTEKSRLTVGKVDLKPGNAHTIPGEVEFTLVGRDVEDEIMDTLAKSCRKVLSSIARRHNLHFDFEELSWLHPRKCDDDIIKSFCNVSEKLGLSHVVMPSGAGHDTQFMAEVAPAGMIFVPSVGGISHAPDEWTKWPDVENGATVLLNTIIDYLTR